MLVVKPGYTGYFYHHQKCISPKRSSVQDADAKPPKDTEREIGPAEIAEDAYRRVSKGGASVVQESDTSRSSFGVVKHASLNKSAKTRGDVSGVDVIDEFDELALS